MRRARPPSLLDEASWLVYEQDSTQMIGAETDAFDRRRLYRTLWHSDDVVPPHLSSSMCWPHVTGHLSWR
jgi:hypothetical protein